MLRLIAAGRAGRRPSLSLISDADSARVYTLAALIHWDKIHSCHAAAGAAAASNSATSGARAPCFIDCRTYCHYDIASSICVNINICRCRLAAHSPQQCVALVNAAAASQHGYNVTYNQQL